MLGVTLSNYPSLIHEPTVTHTHYIHKSFSRELNDDAGEIEDDTMLDVVDIITRILTRVCFPNI